MASLLVVKWFLKGSKYVSQNLSLFRSFCVTDYILCAIYSYHHRDGYSIPNPDAATYDYDPCH